MCRSAGLGGFGHFLAQTQSQIGLDPDLVHDGNHAFLGNLGSRPPLGPEFCVLDTGFFETPDPGDLGPGKGRSRTGHFQGQMASLRVVFSLKGVF